MNRVKVRNLFPSQSKSLLSYLQTLSSECCVLSWYKCKYSVVYLRTVSSKVHGIEQN